MSIELGKLAAVEPPAKRGPGRPRTGAPKSNLSRREKMTRAERDHDLLVRERALERAKKRAEPVDPLRRAVLYSTLGLSLLILTASAIFSFATIAAVGEWLMPSAPWLVILLPIATEFFIVFGGLDTIISQARGDKRGALIGMTIMIAASVVAVVANAAHTLAGWQATGELDWRTWVGIAIAALIPIGTVVASKRAIALVFEKQG